MAINKNSPPVDCKLLDELMSNKYQQQQDAVRAESDPVKQAVLKNKMPVLLPCGIFKGAKGAKNLVNHSGLIAIDIDFKDNQHITNFENLKTEICKLKEVAYCGLSIRGKGYFLVMLITYPDKHKLHFKFIESYFLKRDLVIDPTCINVNRLRYYSYDPKAYYNHTAKPLQTYYKPPVQKAIQSYQKRNKGLQLTGNVFNDATAWVSTKGVQFVEGQRHEFIFLLCSYLQSKGVKRSDAESWIDNNLMPLSEITTNCIEYPYTNFTAGKEIEVKQAPVKKTTPAKIVTITPEQQLEPLATVAQPEPAYTLQQLQAMAMKHLSNTMLRDKAASKANYLNLWANGMQPIISAAGYTKQFFFNSINL